MSRPSSYRTTMLEAYRRKIYIYIAAVSLVFLILIIQVINLQFVQGRLFKQKARINMEVNIPIAAPRGEVYDRNFSPGKENRVLVSNRASFNITIIPANFDKLENLQATIGNLTKLLDIDPEAVFKDIQKENPWQRYVIKEDVPFDIIVKIASHQELYQNVMWEDVPIRVYNTSNMFSHIIGYIGSMSPREYRTLKKKGYKKYQKIGKTGIEKYYDELLRGNDGYVRRIVDVKNRTEGEEVGQTPVAGKSIVLTLDYNLQKRAYSAMGDYNGSVVVLKPSTGEVLAMVSKPDYDPNLIISKNNYSTIRELQKNKLRPFLNRAIQSKYPPASTFKLITATAALEEEKWKPHWSNYCPGHYILKGFKDKKFYCYEVHGKVDLYKAIGQSCSVYFYNLGYRIGPTAILKYASDFGLNEKTGIDIPGEISGFLPSKTWKRRVFGQPWFDGDTINLSIGQGFTTVTPIGMAVFLSGLVNNGQVYRPHLVKEIRSQDGIGVIDTIDKDRLREVPLSPSTLNAIKWGMRQTVTGGTARRLKYLKVPIAGKTGTAQTRSKRMEKKSQHAWFIGFAPFNGDAEKAVAVAVLVEYGIAGAATAVPIAEQVFDELINLGYFK